MKLYEIVGEFKALIDQYEQASSNGDDTLDIKEYLEKSSVSVDAKMEGSVFYYKNLIAETKLLKAEAAIFKAEADRINDMAKVLENKAERFKEYMGYCLGEGTEWSKGAHKVKWGVSYTTEVTDIELVPESFIRVKKEVDKVGAKKAIDLGEDVPGVFVKTNYNLQIK